MEFHTFHGSGWRLVHGWKVQSQGVPRDLCGLVHNSFPSGTSYHEKHLENTSDFLFLSVLAASPGDLHTTWFSSENHVFCVLRAVFKTFQFSLKHFWLFIVFPVYPSLKLTVSFHQTLSKNLHFLHHFIFKSSRKRYGLSLSHFIFHDYGFVFLICELFLWFE